MTSTSRSPVLHYLFFPLLHLQQKLLTYQALFKALNWLFSSGLCFHWWFYKTTAPHRAQLTSRSLTGRMCPDRVLLITPLSTALHSHPHVHRLQAAGAVPVKNTGLAQHPQLGQTSHAQLSSAAHCRLTVMEDNTHWLSFVWNRNHLSMKHSRKMISQTWKKKHYWLHSSC